MHTLRAFTIISIALLGVMPQLAARPTNIDSGAPFNIPTPEAQVTTGISIIVSLKNQCAWLYQDGKVINTSAVCTGKPGKRTPTGNFYVISKHKKWTSTIYHVPMPYFLRLNPGYFGLHAGYMAGKPASHGCIRMPKEKAAEFFSVVPVGTPVKIE